MYNTFACIEFMFIYTHLSTDHYHNDAESRSTLLHEETQLHKVHPHTSLIVAGENWAATVHALAIWSFLPVSPPLLPAPFLPPPGPLPAHQHWCERSRTSPSVIYSLPYHCRRQLNCLKPGRNGRATSIARYDEQAAVVLNPTAVGRRVPPERMLESYQATRMGRSIEKASQRAVPIAPPPPGVAKTPRQTPLAQWTSLHGSSCFQSSFVTWPNCS